MISKNLLIISSLFAKGLIAASPVSSCKAASPQPSGIYCNAEGGYASISQGSYYTQPQTTTDANACRDLCLHRVGDISCLSFSYDSSSKLCQINNVNAWKNGSVITANASSTSRIWDNQCFTCKKTCPGTDPTSAGNVLDNGGFETSPTYLGPWQVGGYPEPTSIRYTITSGYNSSRAALCDASKADSSEALCLFGQMFSACPGRSYRITFDYKLIVFNHSSQIYRYILVSASPEGYDFFGHIEPQYTGSWKSLDFTTSPLSDTGDLSLDVFAYDEVFLDNVVVTSITAPAKPIAGAANAVINGGFESGSISPWKLIKGTSPNFTTDASYSVSSPGLNGTKAFYGKAYNPYKQPGRQGPIGGNVLLYQNTSVVYGKSYLVQFSFRVVWWTMFGFDVYVRFGNETGSQGAYEYHNAATQVDTLLNNTVQTFSRVYAAPYDKAPLQLSFNQWATLEVDGIVLQEVPKRT